ncbi:hypothetical protein D8674_000284 [Pyrus ussuriensis x Pyrus communis]|uniref:Uncharacterized protein n=1 Tax=Pyrus ussuriensis x Pyrus communis TaxID=2448454 RepID=A0A5N5FG38_9ROSA|nr:hypothetical protein D8674_000284 [Pyrus ussuriensis x Pyrus communis]
MVTPIPIAFIVDRYLCNNSYLVTSSLFRIEASSLIAKIADSRGTYLELKSLLSMMNIYNAGESPAVSAPTAMALQSFNLLNETNVLFRPVHTKHTWNLHSIPSHPVCVPNGTLGNILVNI